LLVNLGEVAQKQGNLRQAEAYSQEGLALARQLQRRIVVLHLLTNLGTIATKQGNYTQAEGYLQEGLDVASQLDSPRSVTAILLVKGELLLKKHHLEEAAAAFHQAEEHLPEGQQDLTAQIEYGLARVAYERGNVEEARRLGEASVRILEQIGHNTLDEVQGWLYKALK
jgi:ATP/maltotriose-dependent transcriptional regulator MalT